MKNKVLAFLVKPAGNPQEQFNEALGLFMQCEKASFAQKRYLNASGFSPNNLQNLLYDLQKAVDITDGELLVKKSENKPVQEKKQSPSLISVPEFSKGPKGNKERKDFCAKHGIEYKSAKNIDLDEAINDFVAKQSEVVDPVTETGEVNPEEIKTKEEVFEKAPEEVKEYIALHDEFPFLDNDDCPEELLILVGKKRKHYRDYVANYNELLVLASENGVPAPMTNEQIFDLAKSCVDSFEKNDLIYKELNHFKTTGEILGAHPIFTERNLKEGIDNMTMAQAAQRAQNLEAYIRRDARALEEELEKGDAAVDAEKLQDKIKNWKIELGLLNAKLGAK